MRISVAVQNFAELVPDEEVKKALPAFQYQVNHDFSSFWHAETTLHWFEQDAKPPKTMWHAAIVDDPDAENLGDHDIDSELGLPRLVVSAGADKAAGIEWTVTFSHELLECLADPWINACAQVDDQTFYALEVCDPVLGDPLAYQIEGVWVSDFVTPAWFSPESTHRPGRVYDFGGYLKRPFEIAEYGYACIFRTGEGWKQHKMQDGELVELPMDGVFAAGPAMLRPRRSQIVRRSAPAKPPS
jgi:hypothetical protein